MGMSNYYRRVLGDPDVSAPKPQEIVEIPVETLPEVVFQPEIAVVEAPIAMKKSAKKSKK